MMPTSKSIAYIFFLLLSGIAGTGMAQDPCAISSPASCGDSNHLYRSRGFADAVTAVVTEARKGRRPNRYFIPTHRMVEDMGQVPQGMDAEAGYRIFYGSHKGNRSFRGALAVSDAGHILGIGVFEPFSFKPLARGRGVGLHAEIYTTADHTGFDAGRLLLDWSRRSVAQEREMSAKDGRSEYVRSATVDFYLLGTKP